MLARLTLVLALLGSGCAALRAQAPHGGGAEPAAGPTPRPFALPAATRFVLPNGVAASVVRRPHLPIVSVRVVLGAGDRLDEAGRAGLADLTAALLKRGAGGRTAPAFAEAIDATGGSLEVGTTPDAVVVDLKVLKRDLAKGLGLLADVLTRPALDAGELASLAAERRAEYVAALDDGDEMAGLAVRQVTLSGHPYGRPPSIKALGALRRPDVQRFYTRWYRPERATALVVGDVEPAEAQRLLTQALGAWGGPARRAAPVAEPPLPRPQAATRPTIWLVDMDVTQSFVRLGAVGPARRDPDRPALDVMNFILGGDFTSRLNQEIRDRAGLAYGASSRFATMRDGGLFVARLNTRTETTRQAVDRLLAILKDIRERPVTPAELQATRAHLAGAFPMRFETNADVAGELADAALFGLPDDDFARYRERVRAVTAADVQAVARRWVPADGWHLVVVGRAAAIAPQLAGLGEVRRLSRASLVD